MKLFTLCWVGWVLDMTLLSRLGPPGSSPVAFAFCYAMGFGLMVMLVRTCPQQWSRQKVILLVVVLGVIGRATFIDFPVSNDMYRYIWEGYIQHFGFNPYRVSPDHPSLSHLAQGDMAAVWQQINHRDLSAAYPPLAMLLFRGLAAVSTSPVVFKGAFIVFDLVTLAALIGIVRQKSIPTAHLFWYAANPLVLVYVAGEGHLDSIQAAFITLGLYFLLTKKPVAGFLMLGSAVVSKYISLVALPFVMQRSNRHAWPAAVAAVIWFLPYSGDPLAVFDSLFHFAVQMHYNDGLGELVRFIFDRAAVPVLALILVGILAVIYLVEHDTARSVFLALGAVLLCLPTLHPWYLLMVAPLVVLYPSRAWLYLMLATMTTLPVMAVEHQTGVFQEMRWLKLVAYLPFFGLLAVDTILYRRPSWEYRFAEPRSVSVIIPALNEGDRITQAIHSLRNAPRIDEVIVADGGSVDVTRELALRSGARVVESPKGRGVQVRAAVDGITSDVILVLHADTVLLPRAVDRMFEALTAQPSAAGGAFGMNFAGASAGLRLIEWLNNIRAALFGISFGDQGQFFRRAALESAGGFPDMKLMEDVEMSMRLKGFGRPLFIHKGVQVSQRRWARRGYGHNIRLVLHLFFRYLIERRFRGPSGVRTDYYGKYYNGTRP